VGKIFTKFKNMLMFSKKNARPLDRIYCDEKIMLFLESYRYHGLVLEKPESGSSLDSHLHPMLQTDPDPAFHFDTDPDPAFQFDTDPDPTVLHGSGSLPFQRGNVPITVLFIHLY
jgi:hypothetical protein